MTPDHPAAGDDEPGPCTAVDDPPEPDDDRPPGAAPAAEIVVLARAGTGLPAADVAWLKERLEDAVPLVGRTVSRVTVTVLDDGGIAALHERHLGQPGPTDVLSFATEDGHAIEVDVAVNADEARRQARVRGHAATRELLLYALHGVLHAIGHDDHDAAAFERMHAEEDRILAAIGVGETFRVEPGDDDGERPAGGAG